MNEMITFPDTWEEYEKQYGFTDDEKVYTNGSRLIPSFRVKQWLDHLPSVQPKTQKLLDDGTLMVHTDIDITKITRVNITQNNTHYGDLFYRDEKEE